MWIRLGSWGSFLTHFFWNDSSLTDEGRGERFEKKFGVRQQRIAARHILLEMEEFETRLDAMESD
jgi:hypothetical protein